MNGKQESNYVTNKNPFHLKIPHRQVANSSIPTARTPPSGRQAGGNLSAHKPSVELNSEGIILIGYNRPTSTQTESQRGPYQRTHGHKGRHTLSSDSCPNTDRQAVGSTNETQGSNDMKVMTQSDIKTIHYQGNKLGQVKLTLEIENTLLAPNVTATAPLPTANPPIGDDVEDTEMQQQAPAEQLDSVARLEPVATAQMAFELYVAEKDYSAFFKIRMKSQLDTLSRYNTIVIAALTAAIICIVAGISTTDWVLYKATPYEGGTQTLSFGLFSTCFLGTCTISTYDAPADPNSLYFSSATFPICVASGHQWSIRSGVVRVFSFLYLVCLVISIILSLVINQRPTKVRTQILVAAFVIVSALVFYFPAIVVYDRTFRANYIYCNVSPCSYALLSPDVRSCHQESGWGFWMFAMSAPFAGIGLVASIAVTIRIMYLRKVLLLSDGLQYIKQYIHASSTLPLGSSIDAKIGANYLKAVEESFDVAEQDSGAEDQLHQVRTSTRQKLLKYFQAKVHTQATSNDIAVFSGPDKSSKQVLRPTQLISTKGLQVAADIFHIHDKVEVVLESSEWILDMGSQLMYNAKLNCFWDHYSRKYYLIDEGIWTDDRPSERDDAYRSLLL